ncbi:hypothetical protein [Gracilibacillus boraciitolerans]|nr:hypothetical protein [Gracilibacillus boraciitolerans]
MTQVNRNYFQLNPNQQEDETNEFTILVDSQNEEIVSNYHGGRLG